MKTSNCTSSIYGSQGHLESIVGVDASGLQSSYHLEEIWKVGEIVFGEKCRK
jgi:hypothetical protein